MIVFLTIILLAIVVALTPKSYKRLALAFSTLVFGVLYFFFVPPEGYDLYREYVFIDYIKNLSFKQLFEEKYILRNPLLIELNSTSSNVFIVYAWLISKLYCRELLPFITALIVYGLAGKMIYKSARQFDAKSSAITLSFIAFVFTLDYRSVSAIRNILAYSVFAYTVYLDLIENRNKLICFFVYFFLCQVHMTILIFCLIRVLVLFDRKISRRAIIIVCLCAFSMLSLIQKALLLLPQNDYIAMFLHKSIRYILRYDEGLETYAIRRAISSIGMIIMYLLIYYMCKKTNKIPRSFDKYNTIYLSTIAITIGAVQQYDLLVRNCMLISCLSIPYVMCFWNSCVSYNQGRIRFYRSRRIMANTTMIGFLVVTILMAFSLVYNTYAFYFPMNQYFSV